MSSWFVHIGLLGGAVGSSVTRFASTMGLLLIEIYIVHRRRVYEQEIIQWGCRIVIRYSVAVGMPGMYL